MNEYIKEKQIKRVLLYYGIEAYDNLISNYYDDEIFHKEFKDIIDRDNLYPILNNTRVIKS